MTTPPTPSQPESSSGRTRAVTNRVSRPARSQMARFEANPTSLRNAARVLIVAIISVVFVASLVVWIFDHGEYPDYGTALWFTLQTVTTVGYGDVPPTSGLGRFVASIVMVCGIATISLVTAIVTSTFYEAAQRERRDAERVREKETLDAMLDRFDELAARLERIEQGMGTLAGDRDAAVDGPPPEAR